MSRQIIAYKDASNARVEYPRYAVTENPSDDFQVASRHVFAWFNDKHDVLYFITDRLCYIWDINLGVKVL
jgi:hypothetical protein